MKNNDQTQKKKSLWFSIIVIFLVVIAAVGAYIFLLGQVDNLYPDNLNNDFLLARRPGNQSLAGAKAEILSQLRTLAIEGRYGDWPIRSVILSLSRGNPFIQR